MFSFIALFNEKHSEEKLKWKKFQRPLLQRIDFAINLAVVSEFQGQ